MAATSTKFAKEVLRGAQSLVEPLGGHCRLEHGTGPHAKLVIEIGALRRTLALSVSPRSTDDALKMKMADVRRLLRQEAA